MRNLTAPLALAAAMLAAAPVHAKPADPAAAKQILKDSIAIPTVAGRGKVFDQQPVYKILFILREKLGLRDDNDPLDLNSSVAFVVDQDTHEVVVNDAVVELSPTEFKLLRYLMLNPNRVLSKAQILDHVWEYDFNGDAGIVESYVSYLRRKLDADDDVRRRQRDVPQSRKNRHEQEVRHQVDRFDVRR